MARKTSPDAEEGRAWFAILGGIPAILAWIAYGLCWLLEPRLVGEQDPLLWAGYTAGTYYLIVATFVVGPVIVV